MRVTSSLPRSSLSLNPRLRAPPAFLQQGSLGHLDQSTHSDEPGMVSVFETRPSVAVSRMPTMTKSAAPSGTGEVKSMGKFGTGQAYRRKEDQRFLTGTGTYTDDVTLDGQA